MTHNTLRIYSVLKNEDALPYIGDDVIMVADGLGGSGSTVHKIDRETHRDMRGEIINVLFDDYNAVPEEFKRYVEDAVGAMADERNDTSALWASRIISIRCAYELTCSEYKGANLSIPSTCANLVKDLISRLKSMAEQFDLKTDNEEQRLLPTTLAAIKYKETDDKVVAEAIWAGDSRCYAILPEGLKLLSLDDEDSTGAITNLFYAGNEKCRLNYARYELPKPCILMVVSDGVFDPYAPYDNMGVEATILGAVVGSNSLDELGKKLETHYNNNRGDDATIALRIFGAPEDYNGLRQIFAARAQAANDLYARYRDLYKVLELDAIPDEADSYVRNRAHTKIDYIIDSIVDAIVANNDDVALSQKVLDIVDEAKQKPVGHMRGRRGKDIPRHGGEISGGAAIAGEDPNARTEALNTECRNEMVKALREQRAIVADSVVDAMAADPKRTSVIDRYFNATNLNAFRKYCLLRTESPDALSSLNAELEANDKSYMSLVDKP